MPTSLDRLLADQPALGPAATMLRALIAGMRAIPVALPAGVPHPEAAAARLGAGIPALAGEPLLNGRALVAGIGVIAGHLQRDAGVEHAAAAAAGLSESPAPEADALADAATAGDWDAVGGRARLLDVDESVLVTLADYAARPAMRRAADSVRDLVAGTRWSAGHCPACGGPPLLGELRGDDGSRTLRCGRCATAWPFARLACPACGEQDHRRLHALHGEGEGEFRRAECCDACGGYIKSLATLEPFGADALLEEDLATAALDFLAVERGYHR